MKGDQLVLSVRARVFKAVGETNSSWTPFAGGQLVNIFLYRNVHKNIHHIVCVQKNDVIFTCNIMGDMEFQKTSNKFGQWTDDVINSTYGVSFNDEQQLNHFQNVFNDVVSKSATTEDNLPKPTPSSHSPPSTFTHHPTPYSPPPTFTHQPTPFFPPPQPSYPPISPSYPPPSPPFPSPTSSFITPPYQTPLAPQIIQQAPVPDNSKLEKLWSENDRLRVALAQSACHVKAWQREMCCLRETNQCLRCAIEDSMENVEKWKEQLRCLDEENNRLQLKVQDMEEQRVNVNKKLKEVMTRINKAETALCARDKEIERLKRVMEENDRKDECRTHNILHKIHATERNLASKEQEMNALKCKVETVVPRLNEAELKLTARTEEMNSFKQQLQRFEDIGRCCNLCRDCDRHEDSMRRPLVCLKQPFKQQQPLAECCAIRRLQEAFNLKVKELFELNDLIVNNFQ